MTSVANTMKNGVDNYKIDGQIAKQERVIKQMTKEIGTLTLVNLDAGEEMSPEIMERYSVIKEARAEIEALQDNKNVDTQVCPKCNKKTSMDMKYCGHCGTKFEEN